MTVTPITPAQIDEVGEGASSETNGLSPIGHAPTGHEPAAVDPSRGPSFLALARTAYYGICGRDPGTQELAAALRSVGIKDPFAQAPAFAAANPSGGTAGEFEPSDLMGRKAQISFTCAARRQGTAGGNYPADCDWPTCGCDPYADKVISALIEAGALAGEARQGQDAQRLDPKDDHAACKATPSILPPPSPRKGQEENPCPMTVEEAREVLQDYNDPRWLVDYCRRTRRFLDAADRIELALSTIRASEEDR